MNLLKAGGAALNITSLALGYLARRRAHHDTSQLTKVKRWFKPRLLDHHEHCRELSNIYGRQLPADNAAERDCLSVPL